MEDEDAEDNVLERILAGTKDPTRLSFRILASITKNFSEERKIGEGGFGVVYKGVLRNRSIAVKRIKMDRHTVDDRSFERELTSLLHINHQNVVRFLGFCYEIIHEAIRGTGPQNVRLPQTRERLLCFEYISNTSLDKYITDELRGLEWNKRIQIIKGICRGLKYLHEDKKIIHLDLKPKNILVDDEMEPKITDFGLARVAENSHTTVACLTRGYCAPEYEKGGKPTLKCDIYSLGVIIIELVTGRVPADKTKEPSPYQVLRRWKWSYKWNISARQLPLQAEQVTTCIEIAERCMDKEPKRRPSISEIITEFNEIENTSGDIVGFDLIRPSEDDMLGIQPLELRFGFEPNKQISSRVDIKLTNETGNCVAFNIKAEFPLQCSTKRGIVQGSGGTHVVNITLQAQESTTLPSMPDKVIVQSTKVKEGRTEEEITEHMFNHEAREVVDEVNLTVVYDRAKEPQAEPTNVPISKDDKIAYSSSKDRRLNFHPPQKTLATNARTYTYNQAINIQAVDVVAGAMGPLLPKLRKLLKPGHNLLQPRAKKDMAILERQLKRMDDTISKVSQKQLDQLDTEVKHWADEVRELSYDIEDLVDSLLLCSEGSEPTTNKPDGFEGLQETIQDVMDQVKELVDCRPGLAGDSVANSDDPRLKADFSEDHKRLVGIDSTMHALVKRVMGGDDDMSKQKLKIISIFGDGGLGKTTLARAVYDNLAAVFILKAFVTVGRNRDINWVLEDILLRLKGDQYADIHNRKWDERKLTEELRDVLKKKRYLVVIDDIWDKKLWEKIKMALIDHNCGSKIITTSRIFQVAKNSEDCKLEPLSYQHSKELFYATLSSRGKVTRSLDESEEQCTIEILKKCGGVPLAIITIASLLADKEEEDWPKVYKSIGFGHEDNEDVDNTRKILLFSYYDLPHYLKTCLLHVSTFPEDREIEKNTLVWRWVAEGFVQAEKEKTLFMVGERYFNDLINRSLLQPVEGTSYTIHFCHVHDMVLDMICSVAKEENFVSTLLDSDEQDPCSETDERYARRLSIQKRDVKQQDLAKSCSQKQLRSFSATRCRLVFDLMSLLPSFQVLRLLSIDDCYLTGNHSLQNNAGLHHLRYLGLSGTNIGELPMELGHFRFLQTLDLRGNALKALPQSVTLLRQLKCFRSEGTEMRLPDGMGELKSLEELRLDNVVDSPNFVKELGNLTELRVLHIGTYMFGDSLNEALVQSLSRLKKIEELELYDGGDCKAPDWHCFLPSQRLRHLRLHNIKYSHGLPAWINPKFLPMLSHLNVHVKSAQTQDLEVLGSFPELGSLCLFIDEDMIFPDAIAAGAFPKLQYYYMYSPLKYLPGAMPCLQSVEFHVVVKAYRDANTEINLESLKYLPSLMRVHAKINCWDVTMREAKAAETAVRHAVNIHDKCPILVLEHIGSCIDKLKLSSNSDIENVVLAKMRSRLMVQIQRDAEELDYEHIDPTDPEVINYHLKFKVELPSMIESILDETLDEGLPSLVESILNEMLDECRQREAGASSSQQVISRNSNFGALLPSMIKSTIKEIHYLGQLGASNPEQINSTDLEALKHDSDLRAALTSIIKSKIDKYGREAEINSSSSYIGAVWMKNLLEKYNFEQKDSIDQEVISCNLNLKNEQPSIDESMLDEILDQGLPYSVESVLNEMLDECRQREAGASSSKQVISHDSNFEGLLPSMIKSIIKENEGIHGNASNPEQINSTDLEIISHDSDLKAALTSVIKFRIDKCGQGEVEESNSEQIDSTDQEISSSSSNIGAEWMKTLLESQMYEGKQLEAEKYIFEQINSIKPEVISRNLNFRNEQLSIDESFLDEILDQGLPYMVESVLNEMLDECRQREARASSSKQIISRDSNFEALLPSMIKSIIVENDGRQGKLSNPKQINSTDLEIISHDSDLKAALTSIIKFRIDKCGQGEAEESNSEQIGSTDQEITFNTEAVRMKTLLVSQMYEGKQGEAEELNSEHINSIDPEINNNSSNFGLQWFKVEMVIQMLERRKQEEEFDLERMNSINQELLQPELRSPEDRPAEVHQQHFRFPVVKPFGINNIVSKAERRGDGLPPYWFMALAAKRGDPI